MRKILILVFSLFSIFSTVEAKSKKGQDRVLIDKVAMWQVNHQSKVKHHDLAWTNGVLFRGMVEWADYTQDSRYYDFLMQIGKKHHWGFLKRLYHADDLVIAQMYIRMYGLPNYNEFDPTIFVALTYSFIFGWMFGDVGQGLVLVIGGFLLYHFKKMNLAAIISMAGVFSTFFGFMFGSIFGFEDVIEPIWLRPMSKMTDLPMIGRLNTVFIVAVAFGMGMILLTMIIHIINAAKNHSLGDLCFDTNGIAGLVFYGLLVFAIVMLMTGHSIPGGALLAVLFIIPLLCIAFKEQLTDLCEKKKPAEKTGPVMIVVQALFELIEVLLSYFSNTISFVRIGAFAVSHAAMMQVVMTLAGAENGGSANIVVVIIGNIIVMAMEGLVVGIQVLRLEYYEMFGRFYEGSGREFVPYRKKYKK